jgi:hypothetical protein
MRFTNRLAGCKKGLLLRRAPNKSVIRLEVFMGLRPTQGDEKRLPFSNLLSLEAPLSPLSSRPER